MQIFAMIKRPWSTDLGPSLYIIGAVRRNIGDDILGESIFDIFHFCPLRTRTRPRTGVALCRAQCSGDVAADDSLVSFPLPH